jgi:hypothetical protein
MLMAALRRVGVVSLCVVVGLLVFGCVGAWGALRYPLLRQLSGLSSPGGGLVVDPVSGDTLVADAEEENGVNFGVVRGFDLSGNLVSTWTGVGTPAGRFSNLSIYSLAVNEASGDVYVSSQRSGGVMVFDASGGYVCQITGAGSATTSSSECDSSASGAPGGALGQGQPEAVTVDQATGEVYAFDGNLQVIDVFSSKGVYLRRITGASTPAGSFDGVRSMAVNDSTGELLVAEESVVYVFDAATDAYVETWDGSPASNAPGAPGGSFGENVSVAVNDATGTVYVGSAGARVVDVLSPSGAYLRQITGAAGNSLFTRPRSVAVEQSTGEILVLDENAGLSVVDVFAGAPVLVPDVSTGSASGVAATGVTLNGTVNPDGVLVTGCHFEYGTTEAYGHSAGCVESVGSGSGEVHVHADVSGLTPASGYRFRLVAGNENGVEYGGDMVFTTLPVPTIDGIASTNVTTSSADLNANVNPQGYDATYRFEYGASSAYGSSVPVPDGDAGSGTADVPVSVHLAGLTSGTTYHWRVVATSANGTTVTGDQTFVYDTTGGGLPDGRAYEMVTPVQKNGALINDGVIILPPDISEDGSRVILESIQCFGDAGACNANREQEGEPYLFSHTSAGWVTTALAPPATVFSEANTPWLVGAEDGTALFSIPTAPGGEDDWWARGSEGSFLDVGPAYPSSSGPQGVSGILTSGIAQAATADLSRIVWMNSANRGFGFWPFDATQQLGDSVYEYVGAGHSQPVLVGVTGPAGSTSLVSECMTVLGGTDPHPPGALSADGRTVFFTAMRCASGSGVNAGVSVPADELFARVDESQTVLVSGRSPLDCTSAECTSSPASDARFEGASVDGSKVFFASTQQLTDSASEDSNSKDSAGSPAGCSGTTGANGCNLYEYDFGGPAGHELTAVSAGDSSGGGPRVQGVVAISSDGSHVYFVAKGVLAAAANSAGQSAEDGANNLYVYERDATHPAGRVAFVAALPSSDYEEWTEGGQANVTPDGRFLVFMSHGRLTADDTSTSGAQQVFRYDAQTGALVRISIGENGFNDNGNTGVGDANIVPAEYFLRRLGPARLDPTMSHDGSFVFFMSPLALTPGAVNDVQIGTNPTNSFNEPVYAQNVYEYHEGHVYLISDGHDVGNEGVFSCGVRTFSSVCLVGSDATGANVFFTTADQLVPTDTDSQVDYYDARVCTVSEPCASVPASSAPACQGEACHGTPDGAPAGVVAASSVFSGPGNLTPPSAVVTHKAVVKKKRVKHKPRKHPKRRRAKGRKATRRVTHNGIHRSGGGRS